MAADFITSHSLAQTGLVPSVTENANGKPANAKEAATQFEGLLIAEMLRSAHESNPGSLGGDDDDDAQSDTLFDMAGQQFAQMLANHGGFGIAKIVTAGLSRHQAGSAKPNTDATAADKNSL